MREILENARVRGVLERVWGDEALPVLAAGRDRDEVLGYIEQVRDRFLNPFLDHRLSDIAGNHAEKKTRRLRPVVERGRAATPPLDQPILAAMLETNHG